MRTVALFLALILSVIGVAAGKEATPDFAYPQTVEKNARQQYREATKRGDAREALRAAIQLDIATCLRISDSFPEAIARFDTLTHVLPAPYSNLAAMLEAQLYSDIYARNSRQYDSRIIPATNPSSNPLEWDKAIFYAKVQSLIATAMAGDKSAATPLADIRTLLTDADDAIAAGFSIADFLALRADASLRPFSMRTDDIIPFGDIPSQTDSNPALKYIDDAIDRHAHDADLTLLSFFCRHKYELLTGDAQRNYLDECYARLKDTPQGARWVATYASRQTNPSAIATLEEYLRRFPDAPEIGCVQADINRLLEIRVSIGYPTRILPQSDPDISLSVSNLQKFYLLAYKLADDAVNVNYGMLSRLTPVWKKPVNISAGRAVNCDTIVKGLPMAPGIYAIVASVNGTTPFKPGNNDRASVSTTTVSGITYLTESNGDATELYIVSGADYQPLPGVKVSFYPLKYGAPKKDAPATVLTTDASGKVTVPEKKSWFNVATAQGRVSGNIYTGSREAPTRTLHAEVFTDLSIFHPADTVRFAAVVWSREGLDLGAAPGESVTANLTDTEGNKIASVDLVTDEQGRAEGSFALPAEGRLGAWQITVRKQDAWIGNTAIQVAEYKAPTFRVILDGQPSGAAAGEPLVFKGTATTYAEMPVADATVNYTVHRAPVWWRQVPANGYYSGSLTTDASGEFSILLPTKGLQGTDYATGNYILEATVTDPAGESVESNPLRFSLGKEYIIRPGIKGNIKIDSDTLSLNVPVYDLAGYPVVRELDYEVLRGDEVCLRGTFESPRCVLPADSLSSGEYRIIFTLPAGEGSSPMMTQTDVVLWRADDAVPPIATPLWVPEREIMAPAGARSVPVRVGSSYAGSWILATISDGTRLLSSRWVRVSEGCAIVDVPVAEGNDRTWLMLAACRDLKVETARVAVIPRAQQEPLKICAESFRDRVAPGAPEKWRFRVTIGDKHLPGAPVAAVMTNKALNSIYPFEWTFNPQGSLYHGPGASQSVQMCGAVSNYARREVGAKPRKVNLLEAPDWNLYGYGLYPAPYRVDGMRLYATMHSKNAADAGMAGGVVEDMMADKMEETAESAPEAPAMPESMPDVEARDVECPLAFFMPLLTADAEGIVAIDFTAPQFVGTWQLQVMSYTPGMKGAVTLLDAVAAKRVMAQLNAPRFVRMGDKLYVSATLYNNSEETAPLGGRITVRDNASGVVILDRSFGAENLAASASRTVTAQFDVPYNADSLEIAAYAYADGSSDGEKAEVPVLAAAQPITDATPFYIAPGTECFEMQLPSFGKDAEVTLSYCDSPVWECVASLPSLSTPDSENALTLATAIFGNAVGAHLFAAYPRLRETARSDASLAAFADTAAASAAFGQVWRRLEALQQPDGGWSWCPGMSSSAFITGRVLGMLAKLKGMDALPAQTHEAALRAFDFMDAEFVRNWELSKRKSLPLRELLPYLLSKALYGVDASGSFRALDKAAMSGIRKGWKGFDVSDKAFAARLLYIKEGRSREVGEILESLRQYAVVTPERGMWFANEENHHEGVLVTAHVLEAFGAAAPESGDVDLLRQSLLVSRQTREWRPAAAAAEAVYALLTTGSDWTLAAAKPEVLINGRPLAVEASGLSGIVSMALDAEEASGARLEIRRESAGPAWGGVVASYVVPISEVTAAAVPQLSVTKEMVVVAGNNPGAANVDDPTVGDRVRVTLTITNDRVLDYVVVSDPRAACLEPVDKLSGYVCSDGVWFYREVREAVTNLFIPSLPKGTHVISYECMIDRAGTYAAGAATVTSELSPIITAHSKGVTVKSEE